MDEPHLDLEVVDLAPAQGQSQVKASSNDHWREHSTGARSRRFGRGSGLALLALALGLSVGWAYVAYRHLGSVRDDLFSARGQLDQAATALKDGDFDTAQTFLQSAKDTFATVPDRVAAPQVFPAKVVPEIRRTLNAVSDLAVAADLVAGAGLDVTGQLGAGSGGLGALTPKDGRVPVEALAELAPVLIEAETAVLDAQTVVTDVPRSGIYPAVREARDSFLTLIDPVVDQVITASRAIQITPALFGQDGPRRYMVVAANPTEARGSGGFFGAYTIMEAVDGQLTFSPVNPTQDLEAVPRGRIPWADESLEERYDKYGGTGFFLNLNMTPDFPAAATAIERFYRESTDEQIDGVIAVNPFAFEALLGIAGPVDVPGFGSVGPNEVVEFVSHDAYSAITDPEERKRLIGLVATAALGGFLDNPGGVSADEVLTAVGDMVTSESFLMHTADADEQTVLEQLGVAGRLGGGRESEGDVLGVFLNSGSPSKVDYWLQRRISYDVSLAPNGQAVGTLTTGFSNGAPTTGEPTYMVGGVSPPLDVGDVLSFVSVYCAPGCRFHEVPDAGFEGLVTERGTELGFGVTSTWMQLKSGEDRDLLWTYATPSSWKMRGLNRVYRLHYDHQPMITPTQLQVRVDIPPGHDVAEMPPESQIENQTVVINAAPTTDLNFELVFSPVR